MTTYNQSVIFRKTNCCKDKKYFSSLEMICFTRGYLSISLNLKTNQTCFNLIFARQECQKVYKYTQVTLDNTDQSINFLYVSLPRKTSIHLKVKNNSRMDKCARAWLKLSKQSEYACQVMLKKQTSVNINNNPRVKQMMLSPAYINILLTYAVFGHEFNKIQNTSLLLVNALNFNTPYVQVIHKTFKKKNKAICMLNLFLPNLLHKK